MILASLPPPVGSKELCDRLDGGRLSSDGGVWLFAGIDKWPGIAELLASRVADERDPASTTHPYAGMIRAFGFQYSALERTTRMAWAGLGIRPKELTRMTFRADGPPAEARGRRW